MRTNVNKSRSHNEYEFMNEASCGLGVLGGESRGKLYDGGMGVQTRKRRLGKGKGK